MTKESCKSEILMLEGVVKTLLFIVSEYITTNTQTDDWGKPLDFSVEMSAIRDVLRKTETFGANWK